MPERPSQASIEGLVQRLLQAIAEKNYTPFVVLNEADRQTLHDLVATDPIEAGHVVDRLRATALSAEGWTETKASKINLRLYVTTINRERLA